ncbi:hypothetical protein BZA77DRAFT_307565 [Pyronema omphalodes]|nr:hypothetical protein BZA77DRAFT_307565 [Pyronema omphalodes]
MAEKSVFFYAVDLYIPSLCCVYVYLYLYLYLYLCTCIYVFSSSFLFFSFRLFPNGGFFMEFLCIYVCMLCILLRRIVMMSFVF